MAVPTLWQLVTAMGGGDALVRQLPHSLRGIGSLVVQPGKTLADLAYRKMMEEAYKNVPPPEGLEEGRYAGLEDDEQGPREDWQSAVEWQRGYQYPTPVYPNVPAYQSVFANGGMVVPPYYPNLGRYI